MLMFGLPLLHPDTDRPTASDLEVGGRGYSFICALQHGLGARSEVDMAEWRSMVFRRVWPSEDHRVHAHLLRLEPDDRRLRFVGSSSDGAIGEYVARIDWARSVFVGCEIDGTLRALGELRFVRREWTPTAEVAITVERPYQGRGIGTRLFRRLATLAANRGARRVFVLCMAQNQRMRNIVVHYDADLTHYDSEVEGQVRLPWPSHLTYAQELLDEYVATVQTALAPRSVAV